jgi:hypothetical protein
MSIKDKLEIGLKPDAPYRKDNLPESQQGDENCQDGARPGDDAETEESRRACDDPEGTKAPPTDPAPQRPRR